MSEKTSALYRCGVYVRVSTEEQAEKPEGSIKNQEQRLREFVKLKNLVAPFGGITGVYSDPGFSAKNMDRPGFQKLMRAIEAREINLILVTEISRLTRSMKDFAVLQEFLKTHGCEFLSLRENFDTSSATGGMVLNIMASIAEFERRQTAERIAHSFFARAKRGLYNGGPVPLGYRIDEEKRGSLAIVPEEAEVVKLIFTIFLQKETLAQTAKWLNDQRIEYPRHVRGSGVPRGRIFKVESVHQILTNKAYAGIHVYRAKRGAGAVTEETQAAWQAIIPIEMFERVQKLLSKNRYRKRSHLNLRYPYTLSGVSFCKSCGDRMAGKSAHGRAGKIAYYEHSWATKQQSALNRKLLKCEPHRILAKRIEPEVWSDVKRFLTSEEFVKPLLEQAEKAQPANDRAQELKRLEGKCKAVGNQVEVLAERIAKLPAEIDPKVLYLQLERLQKMKQELEAARTLAAIEAPPIDEPVSLESLQAFTSGLRGMLAKADKAPELQAVIISKVVHRVDVTRDGYEIAFYMGEGYFRRELGGQGIGSETVVSPLQCTENEKGDLVIARSPSKPLSKFFLARGSKSLQNGGSRWDRTTDPLIKSQLLYQLS